MPALVAVRRRLAAVLPVTLAAGAIAAAPAAAAAQPLTAQQILTQFNAVIRTTFTSGHDVEGRLVARTITGGATFYNNPHPGSAPSAFRVVNAINVTGCASCNVNNGGSVNVQGSNAGTFNFNGGGSLVNTPSFAMADFEAPLNDLSAGISALAANSTYDASDMNNFKFLLTPVAGRAVVRVTAADAAKLFTASSINFIGSASSIFVDVLGGAGGYAQGGGSNFNAGDALDRALVWNFAGASSLGFKFWHGAVLAPNAAVTNSSPIEGLLYANSFVGNGELHDRPFAGSVAGISAVPEPSTVTLVGAALVGAGALARRRRRAADRPAA